MKKESLYEWSSGRKAGKEFYRNFICAWLEQDKNQYLAAIEKISKDIQLKELEDTVSQLKTMVS